RDMKLATASALLLFLLGLVWLGGSHGWGADASSSLQKRAGGADQNYNHNQQAYPTGYGWQYTAKVPAKGGVTASSSASRAQPSLLHWLKFW
uniref:Dermokine n=1 Tax=Propithecus coquereli TaxID=379532 RepID=A0A2K6G4G3_PROCO